MAEQFYTQADLDRYLQRGEQYRQFLVGHDECGKCGNAACRGTELFPVLINNEVKARCWDCLVLGEQSEYRRGVGAAMGIVQRDIDRLKSIPERTKHGEWMLEDLEEIQQRVRALLTTEQGVSGRGEGDRFREAIDIISGVQNANELQDGGYFEAGFIAAKTKIIDALLEESANEEPSQL